MKTTGTPHDQACLAFAHDLYGHEIQFDLRDGAGDAYTFHVGVDRALHVKAGSARGVLYAVYDALAGKRSGDERPEFVIRGLNPCESLNRHTPEQLVRFMDRMGRWRMNTLIIHSNYGFRTHQALIEREAAKRGIELVHYTYSNLCFMDGIAPEHFAKDSERRAMWDRAECETRLCVSDAQGLRQYAANVRRYLEEHPAYARLLFATADGYKVCQCPGCRGLNALGQWQKIFDPFFDEACGRRKLEMLVYLQRFSVPPDLARINRIDRVLFDTHLRYPRAPLGAPHAWMKQGARFCGPADPLQDPRGDQPINVYLWDRLVEWRQAFKGQLYVFENLMIQGICSCPRPNTSIYLDDLRNFRKLGIDGVVYEAFEPGIDPFLPTFDAIAVAMWAVDYPYTPTVFERAYLDPDDGDFFGRLPGHPKWDRWRGNYPRAELAKRLYHFNRLTDVAAPPGSGAGGNPEKIIVCCREILDYIINHPQREDLDWIYMGHPTFEWVPPYLVVVG